MAGCNDRALEPEMEGMTGGAIYSREGAAVMRNAVREGSVPECPHCAVALRPREVPRPTEVSYVRERVWWICPECRRSLVLDVEEGTKWTR